MKLTQTLCKQHLGRLLKQQWYAVRNRKILDTKIEPYLSRLGIQIEDATEVIQPEKKYRKLDVEFLCPRIIFDETHPDWNARTCLIFKNNNVLQEGLPQAQILTNTICLPKLPSSFQDSLPDLPEYVNDIVKRAIYNSSILDAHQEPLPKRKDPARPMWVFPRDYGITNERKMRNLSRKFLQICESISGPNIARERCILHNEPMILNLDKETDLIQFNLKLDMMIMSTNPLKPIENPDSNIEIDLPSIYPIHHTISLNKANFYQTNDIYPISSGDMLAWKNVHTIFMYCDPQKVKNLTELSVTESQLVSRSLIQSYTAAATCARYRFGMDVKKLPEPVTVQSIQTDGKYYHFFLFQLNSLDANDTSVKNFWYTLPSLVLYEKAQYDNGRPVVEGYNPEVFRRIVAFYRNGS